jgi:hypothetical protein
MGDVVEACLFLLIGGLALVTLFAALAGMAGLFGGRVERCVHCHHFGISMSGPVHADGCPPRHRPERSPGNADRTRDARRRWSGPLRHTLHH